MARETSGFFLFDLGRVALLGWLPHDQDLRPSLSLIAEIEKGLSEFVGTKENQADLQDAVADANDLINKLETIIQKTPFPSMTGAERSELGYRLLTFRDRLPANLGKLSIWILEEKDGRSVRTLWTAALTLIDPRVTPHLSDFVKENFEEAAKCWLVDRATATGFHMMRSVEKVLRVYRELVTGQPYLRTAANGRERFDGFGRLVQSLDDHLKNLKTAKASFGQLEFIVGLLRPLQDLLRDPLSHPELKKLDDEDAKTAFNQGREAISKMVLDAIQGGSHFTNPWKAGIAF
jgi:hypothetical protein